MVSSLWLFNLWNRLPGKSVSDIAAFESRVAKRHSEYYGTLGFRYLGAYNVDSRDRYNDGTTWESFPYSHAYIYLVEGSSPQKAQARVESDSVPNDILRTLEERRQFNDVHGKSLQVWLQPIGPSHEQASVPGARLIQLYLYQALQDKKLKEFERFEKMASRRYAEYVALARWHYGGAHLALGLGRTTVAFLHTVAAESPDEAVERIAASPPPSDVQTIIAQRGMHLDVQAPHYAVWFTPIVRPI